MQVRYRTALQLYLGESMRATLVQQLVPGAAAVCNALERVPGLAFVVPVIQVLAWT